MAAMAGASQTRDHRKWGQGVGGGASLSLSLSRPGIGHGRLPEPQIPVRLGALPYLALPCPAHAAGARFERCRSFLMETPSSWSTSLEVPGVLRPHTPLPSTFPSRSLVFPTGYSP